MERLTIKKDDGRYYINQLSIDNSYSAGVNCLYGKPIDKLAEFEDFMEEQGFESLEDLKNKVEIFKKVQNLYSGLGARHLGKEVLFIGELIHLCTCEKNYNQLKKFIDRFAGETLDLINNYGCDDLIPAHRVLMKVKEKIQEFEKVGEHEETN